MNDEYHNDALPTVVSDVDINAGMAGYITYTDSTIATTTIESSWTLQPVNQFRNEAGDEISWTKKTGWEPRYVRKPRKTVTGEYHSGKLYKRTHTVTVSNPCMEHDVEIDVEEWATMEDIIGARLGEENNGC